MASVKTTQIEILQNGNPVLREVSSAIPTSLIKSLEIRKTISLMKKAIAAQIDAAAISAVQIGKPLRLFIISKKVFNTDDKTKSKSDLVFINPKITKVSKTKQVLEEGCLSVKYVYGRVLRPEKATVEAQDENGKKFVRGFSGLLAQIVQHETDHLNGILFIDKATELQKISPDEYDKMLKEMK